MPKRTRHPPRARDRLGADRHRPGLRVRLLGHAGVQGAAQRRARGRAGQQQPGDDHDRPGAGRPHLRRAADARDRRGDHRAGAARRAAADRRRADRAQPGRRARRTRHARPVRRRADRRVDPGHQGGRGPPAVPRRDARDRHRRAAERLARLARATALDAGRPRSGSRPSSARRSRWAASAAASPTTSRSSARSSQRGLGAEPGARGAGRGVGDRLEGIRARGDARRRRQLRRHLLDREHRPDGRAHRRQHHRGAGADADRQGIPADARRGAPHHPAGRRRDGRVEHPVRRQPDDGPDGRDRDEPARVAVVGAGVEGHRVPDREDRGQAGARLPPRRDPERHHARDAGVLRADDRLRRREDPALGLREVPARPTARSPRR